MFRNFWPVSEDYASALKPIFLADLKAWSERESNTSFLVRDGLVPLVWFFMNNPTPNGFNSTLRIHSDFECYIPEAWRPQVELYEFFSDTGAGYLGTQDGLTNEVRQLVLMGIVTPSFCSLSRLQADLKEILAFIGGPEKLDKVRIKAFLPVRDEGVTYHSGIGFFPNYLMKLYEGLKADIEFIELEGLKWMYFDPGTWVHEFNEGHLFKDSFLRTLALSKGGRFIPTAGQDHSERAEYSQVIPVYPHVSCGIRTKFTKEFFDYTKKTWVSENQELTTEFYRAMNSFVNTKYPWSQWIPSISTEKAL